MLRSLFRGSPTDRTTDETLTDRLVERDPDAFEALYDRHSGAAYSLALRILGAADAAEDVTQEVFLSVWRTPGRYDPRRGAFRTWLLTMVHSRAIERLRSNRAGVRRQDALEREMTAMGELNDARDDSGETRVLTGHVGEDLARLPEEQQIPIILAYYSGLSHREIGEYLELPIGTVKSRIRLGMAALRERLGVEP